MDGWLNVCVRVCGRVGFLGYWVLGVLGCFGGWVVRGSGGLGLVGCGFLGWIGALIGYLRGWRFGYVVSVSFEYLWVRMSPG